MASAVSKVEEQDRLEKAVAIVMKHAVSIMEKKNDVPTMEGCVAVFQEHGQKWLEDYLKDSSLVKFSAIGWKMVVKSKRDADISSSKQMEGAILQSLKEITDFQAKGATVGDLWAFFQAAYTMPESVDGLKQLEVKLKCGVDTLKIWDKVSCKGGYLVLTPSAFAEAKLGMVDKSVEADVKKLRSAVGCDSNIGSQMEQFGQALEKARADGFIPEEVYKGIQRYAEVKYRPHMLVQHKNRIVSLRRAGKVLVGQAKVFLRGSRGHFGVRTAVAYLLWNEEVLQFLAGIPLTLDEGTKTDMYKKAMDEILEWFKSIPAQKNEAATKKVEPEVQQKRKYDKQEIKDFCNTLAKARRDATITEDVYQAIQCYSEKRHAQLWIAKFKNSILPGTKEGARTVKRLNKFSKSAHSMWPVSLAIAYLLWTGELLKFAQDSEVLLDEGAMIILYQGAEKAVLDWSVTNSRLL